MREMDHALAATALFAHAAGRLQFSVDKERVRNPVPSAGPEQAIRLGEIVELEARFELKSEYATFAGEFRPNLLLELLYGWLGFFDCHLVVCDFAEASGQEGRRERRALFRFGTGRSRKIF